MKGAARMRLLLFVLCPLLLVGADAQQFPFPDNNRFQMQPLGDGRFILLDKKTGEWKVIDPSASPRRPTGSSPSAKPAYDPDLVHQRDPEVSYEGGYAPRQPERIVEHAPPRNEPPAASQAPVISFNTPAPTENANGVKVEMVGQEVVHSAMGSPPAAGGPLAISDAQRRQGEAQLRSYLNKLEVSAMLGVRGTDVTGQLGVRNNGNRPIEILELTIYIPTGSGATFKEERVLYLDRPGHPYPPQPSTNGEPPPMEYWRVETPAPGGGGNTPIKVIPTYIKFADY
jgi:hypothetical protein